MKIKSECSTGSYEIGSQRLAMERAKERDRDQIEYQKEQMKVLARASAKRLPILHG